MKSFKFLLPALLVSATVMPVDHAHAQSTVVCSVLEPPGDSRAFTCPLPASASQKRHHFQALFGGGHDDTTASMNLTLDGAGLTCERGSKTSLAGEDGEVSLECHFIVAPTQGRAAHSLAIALTWRHAQYLGYKLSADRPSSPVIAQ